MIQLTNIERKILLSFAKANMGCDIDNAESDGAHPEPHFANWSKAEIKKTWLGIIKKLKTRDKNE
jgi:hypothetical protein